MDLYHAPLSLLAKAAPILSEEAINKKTTATTKQMQKSYNLWD